MFNSQSFDELVNKLFNILPSSLQHFEKDLKKQFQEILERTFSRLNLVSREEFEVQKKVLARTREKVEKLQKELDHLKSVPTISEKEDPEI